MKNRIEQYQKIKNNALTEYVDKRTAKEWARADDDGFAIAKQSCVTAKNNSGSWSSDQDLDCWSDLWQCIRTKGSRFLK